MKLNRFISLFPLVFFIHDIEEIVTVEAFLHRYADVIPFSITAVEFAGAFFLLWVMVLIGCICALKGKSFLGMRPNTFFSLLVVGVFLANGIGHVLQFLYFRAYVPGLVTTLVLLLPYCFVTLAYLLDEKLITVKKLLFFIVVGFVIQTPAALGAILIVKAVFK